MTWGAAVAAFEAAEKQAREALSAYDVAIERAWAESPLPEALRTSEGGWARDLDSRERIERLAASNPSALAYLLAVFSQWEEARRAAYTRHNVRALQAVHTATETARDVARAVVMATPPEGAAGAAYKLALIAGEYFDGAQLDQPPTDAEPVMLELATLYRDLVGLAG